MQKKNLSCSFPLVPAFVIFLGTGNVRFFSFLTLTETKDLSRKIKKKGWGIETLFVAVKNCTFEFEDIEFLCTPSVKCLGCLNISDRNLLTLEGNSGLTELKRKTTELK